MVTSGPPYFYRCPDVTRNMVLLVISIYLLKKSVHTGFSRVCSRVCLQLILTVKRIEYRVNVGEIMTKGFLMGDCQF